VKNKLFFIVLLGLLLGGCATVPMEDVALDNTAKTFAPVPDKSVIYIYRAGGFGGAIKIPVQLDGHVIGSTAPDVYFRVVTDAGNHKIVAQASYDATLSLVTEPGKVYFVDQEAKWGVLYAGAGLEQVNESDGRAGVAKCKLAKGGQ